LKICVWFQPRICINGQTLFTIFYEDDVPEKWQDDIALNAEMAPQCRNICEKNAASQ